MASAANVVLANKGVRHHRKRLQKDDEFKNSDVFKKLKKRQEAFAKPMKYARLFLRHLPAARGEIALAYGDEANAMESLDSAESAVQKAVDAITLVRTDKWPTPNPAIYIEKSVRQAWGDIGVDMSSGHKPDDPLCQFVRELLSLGGMEYGLNTVSDMLRNRYRRARSGKPAE